MNLTKYVAPVVFYPLAGKMIPWFAWATGLTLTAGLFMGLFIAPTDYQQGESYRIMFIHVPSAWMSMMIYVVMATSGAIALAWKTRLSEMVASACAPIGASFTIMALITGSIWGKPMWGTYWVWDARLTSELVLLFLYLGFMALQSSIDDPRRAAKATAILALVGVINIPIIHFSVEWWNTLHQPASVSKASAPSIHPTMLWPLLINAVGFHLFFATNILMRIRTEILIRERHKSWLAEMVGMKS
jgi:heme exporter protein C